MPPAPSTSTQALANYQSTLSGQQSPDQIYSAESSSLGVPAAQQQVSGLRQAITNTTNLLNNVAPSVYGRSGNSLVTNAQANAEIANQSAPIQQKLSGLNTSEGNAASDLSSLLTQAGNLSSLKEQGQSDQLTGLKNIYDSLFSQEQAQQSATQSAAQLAEQAREANMSASSKAASSGPSYATPAAPDIASIQNGLIKLSGGDGYVSPQTYQSAFNQWVAAGYDPNSFTKQFGKYKNPTNPNYSV